MLKYSGNFGINISKKGIKITINKKSWIDWEQLQVSITFFYEELLQRLSYTEIKISFFLLLSKMKVFNLLKFKL